MKSNVFKICLNSAVGISLVIVWLQFVNLQNILNTLSKVSPISLAPIFVSMLLSVFLRSLRLKIFLSSERQLPLKDLFFLNSMAQMLNFLIPIRVGEVAKGIYLHTNYNLPIGKSVIWIFLDRFVDFLVVLMMASLLFFVVPTSLSITFIIIITMILFIGLFLTFLAVFKPEFSKKLINFLKPFLIFNTIKRYFVSVTGFFLDSFIILKRPAKSLFFLILITATAYFADGLIWYFTFLAISDPQPIINMYLAQLLSALTYLIPAAPGYIGSTEASGLLIFSAVFGVDTNIASSMIVLFHICTALFVLGLGLIAVYFLKINLTEIIGRVFKRS